MIHAIIQQGMGLVQYQIDRRSFAGSTHCQEGDANRRCGTIPATPGTGPVHSNTTSEAVATPTESGVLSCPNFWGRLVRTHSAMPTGFGLGAVVRKAIGAASDAFETPSPSDARSNADDGFSTPEGAETMPSLTTHNQGTYPQTRVSIATSTAQILGSKSDAGNPHITPTLPSRAPQPVTRKPWPFIAQGDVLTQAQRLRAAARHALRAAALLEQVSMEGGV